MIHPFIVLSAMPESYVCLVCNWRGAGVERRSLWRSLHPMLSCLIYAFPHRLAASRSARRFSTLESHRTTGKCGVVTSSALPGPSARTVNHPFARCCVSQNPRLLLNWKSLRENQIQSLPPLPFLQTLKKKKKKIPPARLHGCLQHGRESAHLASGSSRSHCCDTLELAVGQYFLATVRESPHGHSQRSLCPLGLWGN